MKFTEWLKWDFMTCKEAVTSLFNGKVPVWVFYIYYIVGGIIFLPFMPIAWLTVSYRVKKAKEIIKSFEDKGWDF
jgi:hypothetical protein